MAKIKLTKSAVDAAQPQAKAIELRDTVVPGFLCKITPAGRKVFMLQYRTNAGERRKPALGQYGELTVDQARTMAQEWLAEVRKGGDPSAAKNAARKAPTMKEFCHTFMEDYSKQRNKPSTQRGYQGVIDRCIIPIMGRIKVQDVKTRGSGMVGYNVQGAVDAKHHLIMAHEVTNDGVDRDQLTSMAKQAREAMGVEELSAVAGRGYFKGKEILACQKVYITVFVPKTLTSGATAAGRFGKGDFIYDAAKNEYRCPAGQSLIWRFSSVEKGLKLHRYWSSHCQGCALKESCTPITERRVSRWEHESVLEAMQNRLNHAPEMMLIRSQMVEHPFRTLKAWMAPPISSPERSSG